jgi:hypothetical protein
MFVPGAILGRAGYPPDQAAYAVNGLFQILSFALIAAIASSLIRVRDARALGWILQLLPIAFVFRVRANQEYAVLLGLLLALYSTERSRHHPMWTAGMIAGFGWVLLVKGVFAIIVPLTCGVWLVARSYGTGPAEGPRSTSRVKRLAPWLALLAMPLAGLAIAASYESAYTHVTGRSFLEVYRARQVPDGILTDGSPIGRAVYNLAWYSSRVLWYAFPWSLFVLAGALRWRRTAELSRRTAELKVRPTADPVRPADDAGGRQGAWFVVVSSALLMLVFSAAHRKAERYIFPVYFFVGAAGAVWAIERSPRFARLVQRFDRPWVPAVIYVGLFLLRLVTAGHLPEFTFWRT